MEFRVTLSVVVILLKVITKTSCGEDECQNIASTCHDHQDCRSCIRAHHCCVWCSDKDFNGRRCGITTDTETTNCNPEYLVNNNRTSAKITRQSKFSDSDSAGNAVQFSPKKFELDLRFGEPLNITITYRPAKHYPLDLYYLMDLTYSMKADLDVLRKLGSELTGLLLDLTPNHRIAFGSYIDKIAMPFYYMDPSNRENPCSTAGKTCEKGYLFKHKLNFTSNIDTFIERVNASDLSANLDNLEGGLDVLMQILLCGPELDWSTFSRKLVIVATEGQMHLAGDGILAGSTKRNRDMCLIEGEEYTDSTLYDYPSLEEVHHELKSKKTNLIVAAKATALDYYHHMGELLDGAIFVDELKNDSTKVLDLVKQGYYAFIRQARLSTDTSKATGLDVDFFSDCDGTGEWTNKDTCNNAEEGKEIKFKVQFLLTEYQNKYSEVFYIEEKNIHETVAVKVNFVGSMCDCINPTDSTADCVHGIRECGNCTCDEGWTGPSCNSVCTRNMDKCRLTEGSVTSISCYGRGTCKCGGCECDFPFSGKHCEFTCPYDRITGRKCSGNGICIDGECTCNDPFTGPNCDCSIESCQMPGTDTTCNDNGVCECNRCICNESYYGVYCQNCIGCNQLICDKYKESVGDHVLNKKPDNETFCVETVGDIASDDPCVHRFDSEDGKTCDIYFKYSIEKDGSVHVTATEPHCNKPFSAGILAAAIIASILGAGVLFIIGWKGRNMYRDKIEYERFMRNQDLTHQSEQNPIYRSPVTSYRNPMEMSTFRDKSD